MRKNIVIVAFLALIALLVSANPASASSSLPPLPGTPTCTTQSTGTTVCIAASSSKASTPTVKVTDYQSADAKGKTNLRFEVRTGYVQKVKKCYSVASYSKVPKGAKCFKLTKRGYHYSNSGVNRNGSRYYFDDYVGSKYTPVGSKFYYDSKHHTWRKSNCGNYSKFTGKRPALKVTYVALVRAFSKVKVSVSATSTALGTGWASASCTLGGASAYASSQYSFYVSATAKASAYAYSYASAKSIAVGHINQAKLKLVTEASAKASTSIKASGSAAAGAQCITSTTPPKPVPPTCYDVYGPGYNGHYPDCTKDGTATPPPPPTAPGPNPAPSDPGNSNQCYSIEYGTPVQPNPDGTCPPGSTDH